jgi:hypothetical protein
VLAYTGEQSLSDPAERPLIDFLSEMNSPTEVMALRTLNQAALHTIVASGAAADAVNLEIMLHDWGMVKDPYLAYYGHVAVSDIATWGTYGSRLTTKNLRQFRGRQGKTNSALAPPLAGRARILQEWLQGRASELLLKNQWGPANSLTYKMDIHLDAISDLNEGDAAVHAVILAVKSHRPCNFPLTCPLTRKR